MRVAPGCRVAVDWVIRFEDGGEVIDASPPDAPLTYVHGAGEVPERLERALEGLSAGDRRTVVLPPGARLEDAQQADALAPPPLPEAPLEERALRVEIRVRDVRPPAQPDDPAHA